MYQQSRDGVGVSIALYKEPDGLEFFVSEMRESH